MDLSHHHVHDVCVDVNTYSKVHIFLFVGILWQIPDIWNIFFLGDICICILFGTRLEKMKIINVKRIIEKDRNGYIVKKDILIFGKRMFSRYFHIKRNHISRHIVSSYKWSFRRKNAVHFNDKYDAKLVARGEYAILEYIF